ncbi:MAG: tRNA (5-methylaminomethyl-2-thiouridine)(34)-methyltransferase MnmD [Thermaurantimonas sp.]|uniref:tRNA (5-methylaminomethyl-2-thiouridine)(34)-methyltransferase MnmD n=1 Tax=Thermaurantimonas sp. TaxID=2681568 RepID=UPI00391CB260
MSIYRSMFQLAETKDGSSTLINTQLQQSYHSMHGAIQESMHVFIKEGLLYYLEKFPNQNIEIFEMGYGTGLNAMLTYVETSKHQVYVVYKAAELFPIQSELAKKLNYIDLLGLTESQFTSFHTFDTKSFSYVSANFKIELLKTPFEIYQPTENSIDLIYFDAFSPSAQPELWTIEAMDKCYKMLRSPGVWVTYSAKGAVRRALREVGFQVQKIPGPPGKREMLRALKI